MTRNEKKMKKEDEVAEKRPLTVADFLAVDFGLLSGRW